jgi:hypothetical protein
MTHRAKNVVVAQNDETLSAEAEDGVAEGEDQEFAVREFGEGGYLVFAVDDDDGLG